MPSVTAACAGAIAAGVVEGRHGWLGVAATTGFVAMLAIPILFVTSVIVRGLVAAWQPRVLVASLVEEGGGVPWLAGWVAVIWLGALALVWAMFQGTWLLASWTQFKPLAIGFAQPILAVTIVLAIIVGSRPVAAGVAWLARKLDALWRRGGNRPTLLRPWLIIGGAIVTAVIAAGLIWYFIVKRRLDAPATGFLHAPAAALLVTILVHFARPWLGRRVRLATDALIAAACVATITFAIVVARTRPIETLEIWGTQPLARLAIERVFELEAIRADVPLTPIRPRERPGFAHPDIVLVTIDAARADHTPPYGGPAEMPALRDLGQRGAVFVWAFAPSSVTRRSFASIATGLLPNRLHGVVTTSTLRLDPRHVLISERLRAGGYDTAGFMCCAELWGDEARTGLARGLEHVVTDEDPVRLAYAARSWLAERERRSDNRPLFLWIHLSPSRTGRERDPKTDEERRRFYDHALAATDPALVELFAAFAHRSAERAPIWIVTSEHGQGLGEHGQPYHATDLYSSQLQVPLVIAGPNIKPRRIAETVSLVDLLPTILDLAGFLPPRGPTIDGRSLGDLARGDRLGDANGGTAFAVLIADRSTTGAPANDLAAIVRGGWKLIENGTSTELYDLKSDSAERYNLFGQRPIVVNELKAQLGAKLRAQTLVPFE